MPIWPHVSFEHKQTHHIPNPCEKLAVHSIALHHSLMPPKGFNKKYALALPKPTPRSNFSEAESKTAASDIKASSMFSKELASKLLTAIRMGNFRHVAAGAVGLSKETFTKWCVWGREGREPFASFLADVERTEATWGP